MALGTDIGYTASMSDHGLNSTPSCVTAESCLAICFAYAASLREADLFRVDRTAIRLIVRNKSGVVMMARPMMRYAGENDPPWTFGFTLRSSQEALALEELLTFGKGAIHCSGSIKAIYAAQGDALHTIGLSDAAVDHWASTNGCKLTLLSDRSNPHKVFHVEEAASHVFPTVLPVDEVGRHSHR